MASAPREPDLARCAQAAASCTARSLRRASRAVSGLYDEALRPTGLSISQFGLLVALALAQEVSVSRLGGLLDLDRTTLSRNLAPLERRGLVASAAGADGRVRVVRLTAAGRATLARALPIWAKVQARVVTGLGSGRWEGLLEGLEAAAALSRAG